MSLYKTFATDESVEQHGVWINYGDTRFLIARAGGSNTKFKKAFSKRLKPYRRQIDTGTLDETVALSMLIESYAEAVLLSWEGRIVEGENETWVKTIEGPDGKRLEFNRENVIQVLSDLPDLFADLQAMAGQVANFRALEDEEDAKN